MYHPYVDGYSLLPGLRPLGHDFGNGEMDRRFFQVDENLGFYKQVKLDAEHAGQGCFFTHARDGKIWNSQTRDHIRFWMVNKLQEEYPEEFFDPPQTLNSIGLRIQEDFAIHVHDEEDDWLAYANVHLPSNWLPENNMGKSFREIHSVIPGMLLNKAESTVRVMMNKGPFVRFVWTVVFENKLNFHPSLPRKRFQERSCFHEGGTSSYQTFPRAIGNVVSDQGLFDAFA